MKFVSNSKKYGKQLKVVTNIMKFLIWDVQKNSNGLFGNI